jgi:ketosteroid isomerase-like protein
MRSKTEGLRALWEAWSRGDVDEMLSLLHPDVVWRATMLDREYRGHDGVRSWLDGLAQAWKSLTLTLESVQEVGGDVAVARARVVGFGYGGGRHLDTVLVCVAEFAGELIVRGSVFDDDADAKRYVASRAAG